MAQGRPAIPRPLARRVKEEAGYRCAIPTCKATSALEIAHIRPWSEVQEHTFDNLIYLCAICHTRYDSGEIDRQSIDQYKANLGLVNSRYGDFEKRVLEYFAQNPQHNAVKLNNVNQLFIQYLIDDGMIQEVYPNVGRIEIAGVSVDRYWQITQKGADFVKKWYAGQSL